MDAHKLLSTQVLSLASWMIELNKCVEDEAQGGSQQEYSIWMLPGVKRVQNDPLEGYI